MIISIEGKLTARKVKQTNINKSSVNLFGSLNKVLYESMSKLFNLHGYTYISKFEYIKLRSNYYTQWSSESNSKIKTKGCIYYIKY